MHRTSQVLRLLAVLSSVWMVVVVGNVWAVPVAPEIEKTIRGNFAASRPDFVIASISTSELPGVYAVELGSGPVVYSDAQGKYFVFGDLFQVDPGGFRNVSEERRDVQRGDQLAGIDAEDMIVFPAEGERKAWVSVFTDVDCFYCQKLHKEVPELNRRGVEVRYLAYPRAGVGSDSYRKIASAWCAKDKQKAITMLKNREAIPDNVCAGNPVAGQFLLGQKIGVTGTPALVLQSGKLLPGFMPADALIDRLGIN
ncbi:MAG: thiol:disulfide interchange protein DsbC [Halieaceae bacterium]|jgi:thiol:disulfide interchange protein DsbC